LLLWRGKPVARAARRLHLVVGPIGFALSIALLAHAYGVF